MYSSEQMYGFVQEFMEPRIQRSLNQLKKELNQKSGQMRHELLSCTDRLFKKCIFQQQERIKQPIRYIHFFYLNLSVLTGQYDIQVNAFSEQSYMDKTESMEFWNPEFIMELYEKDMEEMEKEAKKQIPRFGYSQMMDLKRRIFGIYAKMIGQYLLRTAEDIAELPSFCEMEKAEGLQMVYGGYMDTGFQLWPVLQLEGTARQEEKR